MFHETEEEPNEQDEEEALFQSYQKAYFHFKQRILFLITIFTGIYTNK